MTAFRRGGFGPLTPEQDAVLARTERLPGPLYQRPDPAYEAACGFALRQGVDGDDRPFMIPASYIDGYDAQAHLGVSCSELHALCRTESLLLAHDMKRVGLSIDDLVDDCVRAVGGVPRDRRPRAWVLDALSQPETEPEPECVVEEEKPEDFRRHLYVVEILDVGTKVGITDTPLSRIREHSRAARDYGRKVGRVWVSVRHLEAYNNEQALLRAAKSRSEYLRISFDAVMALVEALPMTRCA